jgi:uncharacterized SAM-dependent methyltransferase
MTTNGPQHTVALAPFRIDRGLVTNADYAAFVNAGGYRDRDLCSDHGWAWREAEGASAPLTWKLDGDRRVSRRFDRLETLALRPSVWLYDDRGSRLYEEITQLAEYYLPRREQEILRARASTIAHRTRARTLVELGAGSAKNTRFLNRELDATFAQPRFAYEARWDPAQEWMDIGFRAREAHTVSIARLELDVAFAEGEWLRVEISSKFRREQLELAAGAAGLRIEPWWTDRAGDFAVALLLRDAVDGD